MLLHQNNFMQVLEDRERVMGAGTQRDILGSTVFMSYFASFSIFYLLVELSL